MTTVRETIEVDVPISTAYDQWTQFEDFPRFMAGIDQVKQLDDTRLHWVADIGGQQREWDAKIVEQEPDRRVAWSATEGTANAGAVEFVPLSDSRTEIHLELDYAPEGLVEKAGAATGTVQRRAKKDLESFKDFIESRGAETGAWRGRVEGGQPR
ncbi:MAG: SRPBCC family protein [Actinomycetota bacterium]